LETKRQQNSEKYKFNQQRAIDKKEQLERNILKIRMLGLIKWDMHRQCNLIVQESQRQEYLVKRRKAYYVVLALTQRLI
jgi:hypothetical protein